MRRGNRVRTKDQHREGRGSGRQREDLYGIVKGHHKSNRGEGKSKVSIEEESYAKVRKTAKQRDWMGPANGKREREIEKKEE